MTSQEELHSLLRRGIELARTGKKKEARALIEQVIQADEYNEVAWMWMTAVASNNAERREALEIVLEINPNNERAKSALERLGGSRAQRKATQARKLADRIGSDEEISEAAFQPVVERPAEPEPPPEEPALSPEAKEAELSRKLIATVRQGQAPASPRIVAPDDIIYDFAVERREKLWLAFQNVILTLMIVVVGAVLLGTLIYGGSLIVTMNQPTATPTATLELQTALALLSSATPTDSPFVVVTVAPEERLNVPPTWTPIPSVTPPATVTPMPTIIPPDRYDLIFSRRAPGETTYALYRIRGDGANTQALTSGATDDRDAAFSPDGQRVIYALDQGNYRELAVLDLSGEAGVPPGVTPLSPINVEATQSEGDFTAYVISQVRARRTGSPSWSPDGTRVVFSSNFDGDDEIYMINVDGSGIAKLTHNYNILDRDPAWSPDGETIVFASDRNSPGQTELFSIRPDTTNLMQLTDSQGSSYQPAWSPDGRQIVFASDRNRDSDIFIMGADGANERLLTRNDENAEDRDPAWSPDEQWIAFSSNRDTVNFQIYLIDPVTENVVRVTRNAADDIGPVWLPVAPPRE